MKHWPRTGRPPSSPKLRMLTRRRIRPIQHRGHCRRQFLQPRIVHTPIERLLRIKRLSQYPRLIVVSHIGKVVSNKIRPPKITRFLRLINLVIPTWPTRPIRIRIRSHLTPINNSRHAIHRHPPCIPTPHHIDFWSRLGRPHRKKIPLRDLISPIRFRPNPTNLSR